MTTPDNDQLTRFAAEMLGVDIWWSGAPKFCFLCQLHGNSEYTVFDPLTSWEWLGKGMEYLRVVENVNYVSLLSRKEGHRVQINIRLCEVFEEYVYQITDLPSTFWLCWYRLTAAQKGKAT